MTDERRARYAAAMASYADGHIHEVDGPTPHYYFPLADAAIDVADKENTRLRAELEQKRDRAASLEEQVKEDATIIARTARARALHQHNEDAGYCDLCSNHGDINWPCATIKALEGPAEIAGRG